MNFYLKLPRPQKRGKEPAIHGQGKLSLRNEAMPGSDLPSETIDLMALRSRCNQHLSHQELYQHFCVQKVDFSPSLKAIREVWCDEKEILTTLILPDALQILS